MVGYISFFFFLTQIQVDLTSHLNNWVTKKQLKKKKNNYILSLRDFFPLIGVQQMFIMQKYAWVSTSLL